MTTIKAIAAFAALTLAATTLADAKPRHKWHHARHHHASVTAPPPVALAGGYCAAIECNGTTAATTIRRPGRVATRTNYDSGIAFGGTLARARSYIGTNPTGWRHLWCARFIAMIRPDLAARVRNPNMARSYAGLPHTTPHVGAIAVLARGRGGHIGVVSGFDARGNPIIISGNHNRRVGEGVYPKGRVIAYISG